MKVDKFSIDGKKVGEVELSDTVFAGDINDTVVYEYIKAANANLRQGTHQTKERSDVRGGGAKPWKQKGTGRARAGTNRSPIWVGGGTVFGPHPRSYRIELSKKIKQKAMKSILAIKAKQGGIKVVEDFTVESGKTKDMNAILKATQVEKGLLVCSGDDKMVKRTIKNIPDVKFNSTQRLSGRDLFYSKSILITESAVEDLNKKYA